MKHLFQMASRNQISTSKILRVFALIAICCAFSLQSAKAQVIVICIEIRAANSGTNLSNFTVAPNPCDTELRLTASKPSFSMTNVHFISRQTGLEVWSASVSGNSAILNVEEVANGNYTVHIETEAGTGCILSEPIVVAHSQN